eukprot:1140396-Pelagomonas_calceolata.AAC.6
MDCNGQLDWKAQIPGVVESIRCGPCGVVPLLIALPTLCRATMKKGAGQSWSVQDYSGQAVMQQVPSPPVTSDNL